MKKYNSCEWDGWMKNSIKGDQNSYHQLLTSLRPWLVAYFSKRVHYNVIEDLVQDTLLTLHTKRQTFDPKYSFGPWITAVARNRWIDHLRKSLKYIETEFEDDQLSGESEQESRDIGAKQDVRTLLKLIPTPQAHIIELVKLKELSIKEVSEQTGHSSSSIRVMIHRGMKKMMAAVEKAPEKNIQKLSFSL